jgi:phage gp16-like protein
MNKKSTKKNKKVVVKGTTPDEIAETYRAIYDALLKKGFTTDQSIQLMLSMARS